MMKSKIVYILGAGCSVEDGSPLINDFFNKAFSLMTQEGSLSSKQQIKFEKVKAYRSNNLPGSNVEELLSYLDFKKVFAKNQYELKELNELHEHLTYLIAKTIEICLGHGPSDISSTFCKRILRKEDVIISFNWDLILDNVLGGGPGYFGTLSEMVDYGSDFECINRPHIWDGPDLSPRYKLYKLHGSMNWLYCEQCKKKYYALGKKKIIEHLDDGVKCPVCDKKDSVKGVIVPPTFNKLGDNTISIISDVWNNAFDSIKEADKLVIIGYSFPEDDVHFKMFFKGALNANYVKRKSPIKVEVVNYKPYQNEQKEFEQHYKRIFSIPQVEIEPKFRYMKFSEYVENEVTGN